MPDTSFNCLPTMIGSMPHTDPTQACDLVARYLPDIPAWPQLPARSLIEDMNIQYSEGFPGITVSDKRVSVDTSEHTTRLMEKVYADYMADKVDPYKISRKYASGLYKLKSYGITPPMIKGQIVGPITWGLSVTDSTGKAIIYNDLLADAVPKFLRMKAAWQEKFLRNISKVTIMFLDEPYMTTYGSATFTLTKDKITSSINEVFQGIKGIKGIHCCGNTDWPILLETQTDVISYDAYNYPESLSLYPYQVKRFLGRGGAIAWGIVPNSKEALKNETVTSLRERFENILSLFTKKGISHQQLIQQGLLTPSCGLPGLSEDEAEHALVLLSDLSKTIRAVYGK